MNSLIFSFTLMRTGAATLLPAAGCRAPTLVQESRAKTLPTTYAPTETATAATSSAPTLTSAIDSTTAADLTMA